MSSYGDTKKAPASTTPVDGDCDDTLPALQGEHRRRVERAIAAHRLVWHSRVSRLDAGVDSEPTEPASGPKRRRVLGWLCLGLAAAVALACVLLGSAVGRWA